MALFYIVGRKGFDSVAGLCMCRGIVVPSRPGRRRKTNVKLAAVPRKHVTSQAEIDALGRNKRANQFIDE